MSEGEHSPAASHARAGGLAWLAAIRWLAAEAPPVRRPDREQMIIYLVVLCILSVCTLFLEFVGALSVYWQFHAVFLGFGFFSVILAVLAVRQKEIRVTSKEFLP
jgi:hypothetical protein